MQAVLDRLARIEELLESPRGWLTLKQASTYSGLSERTLRRAIQAGKLRSARKAGKLLFKPNWLDRYILYGKQRVSPQEKRLDNWDE